MEYKLSCEQCKGDAFAVVLDGDFIPSIRCNNCGKEFPVKGIMSALGAK